LSSVALDTSKDDEKKKERPKSLIRRSQYEHYGIPARSCHPDFISPNLEEIVAHLLSAAV
jgi:hypothetical protein